jgi:hypothetical protein
LDIEPLKDAFWAIVADCLRHFHGMDTLAAERAAASLRTRLETPSAHDEPPAGYDADILYHNEPFYMACDITGRELDLESRRAEYDRIAHVRYAVAEHAAMAGVVA